MKKIVVIGVIALFIVVGFQPAFANNIIQETENKEKLQFWWIFVHIQEIYGTLDDPQFRPLANVTVEVDSSAFGIFWRPFWSGRTDKNGEADVPIIDSLLYKVMVSKEGFHTYKCLPFVVIISGDYFYYDVYFTMAEDGSPFNETKSSAGNTLNKEDCDCQSVSDINLNGLEYYIELLSLLSKRNPEIAERCEELSNKISILIETADDTPIICLILWIKLVYAIFWGDFWRSIAIFFEENGRLILSKIFLTLVEITMDRIQIILQKARDYNCYWAPD